jgi:dTDP-4-amino-4,6-dideoxygalactose transaminase
MTPKPTPLAQPATDRRANPETPSVIRIPFNKPYLVGSEFGYIGEAISLGHTAGDGPFTRKCSELLQSLLQAERVLLTTSCTDALEMAAMLLQLREGDEVIVPSFTFVSTANAFAVHGAKPVFVDIRPDTLNLDERQLEASITERTRAVVPVHYAGVGCEMDEIMRISKERGLALIEDNAHGLFGGYRGKPLGSFGALATQSFHETKNVTCGEGGALVINDVSLTERAEVLRDKGTNRSRFFRGQVDKYTWVDYGSSFLPSDILAAYLYGQLMARRRIQAARKRIWDVYATELAAWAAANGVRLPFIPEDRKQPYHMFYLVLPSLGARTAILDHLRHRGILAVFHYQPLHLSEMGRHYGGRAGQCPVTEQISDQLVRLPMYNSMTEDEQIEVVEAVTDFVVPS